MVIEGDCLELSNQVNDRDRLHDWEIVGEVDILKNLLDTHHESSFVWTPREGNAAAHNLAKSCAC